MHFVYEAVSRPKKIGFIDLPTVRMNYSKLWLKLLHCSCEFYRYQEDGTVTIDISTFVAPLNPLPCPEGFQ